MMRRRNFLGALGSVPVFSFASLCGAQIRSCEQIRDSPPTAELPVGAPQGTIIGGPVSPRPVVSDLVANQAYWDRVSLAYRLWNGLASDSSKADDRRGPLWQRDLHKYACDSGIHENWFFLPWHRAFIYFHERILEKLLNDNGSLGPFRLPAWDWEHLSLVPTQYEYSVDNPFFCLHNCQDLNSFTCGIGGFADVAGWCGAGFVGSAATPPPDAASGIYHSVIHKRLSDPLLIMGDFDKAALDPIFYAHHANIDRFFEYWKCLFPDLWAALSLGDKENEEWRNKEFVFYDASGEPITVKVCQFLDTKKQLGYEYALPTSIPKAVVKGSLVPFRDTITDLKPNQRLLLRVKISRQGLSPGLYKLGVKKLVEIENVGYFAVFAAQHHHTAQLDEKWTVTPDVALASIKGTFIAEPADRKGKRVKVKVEHSLELIELENLF